MKSEETKNKEKIEKKRRTIQELRNHSIQVKGKQYPLKFPAISKYMEIERRKGVLSKGEYGFLAILASTGVMSAKRALDIVDSLAYFSCLVPEILVDLKFVDKKYDQKDPDETADFLRKLLDSMDEVDVFVIPFLLAGWAEFDSWYGEIVWYFDRPDKLAEQLKSEEKEG